MRRLRAEAKNENGKSISRDFSAAVKNIRMTEEFREFLANAMRFEPVEKREQIVADAEGMMTDFVRAKVDPTKDLVPLCGRLRPSIAANMV
jgi:hypothetical protein